MRCCRSNVFSIQAAVTRQVPVLVHNICQLMHDRPLTAKYDGYASCPLLVGDGKAILAEFIYGGVPQEVTSTILGSQISNIWRAVLVNLMLGRLSLFVSTRVSHGVFSFTSRKISFQVIAKIL
jgi:hypothetical protein